MANAMSPTKLPQTDSIRELAEFWDRHDLTDFESALEEVAEVVFDSRAELTIQLTPADLEALQRMAESTGLTDRALIQQWIRERLHAA